MTPKQSRTYILATLKGAILVVPDLTDDSAVALAAGMKAFMSEHEPRMLSARELQNLVAEAFYTHGARMVAAIKPTLMAQENDNHPIP